MAGRRTNLALLGLLVVALATGALSYAIGTSVVAVIVVAHGVAGLAIVLLAPWKGAIAPRGMRRPRQGSAAGHGFPARLVVPGRRGFWWVKWVTEIRVDDTPWWWQPPFPVT